MGNAVYRVTLDPQRVAFGAFESDEPRVETLTIKGDDRIDPFNVVRTRTSGENVEAEVEVVEPGKQYAVKIKVTPQPNVVDFQGWVHVITDHPGEYAVIGIPVTATFPSVGGGVKETSLLVSPGVSRYSLAAEIGETLRIRGTTLDGSSLDLVDYQDKPTLVIFWASTCGACRNELASLKQLYSDYHDQGFEILGVNLDTSVERRQTFLNEVGLPWPNLIAAGEDTGLSFARRYEVRAIPSMVLIDRSGKIIAIDKRGDTLRRLVSGAIERQTGA